MSAAEYSFPNPGVTPSWLDIAENVFNDFVRRWDLTTCAGGLKWQIFSSNLGYNYKNAIANGAFFQLAARLTRYTGNETYLFWAEKSFNWSQAIGLIGANYDVYDGTDDNLNCSEVNHEQWSYNVGMHLYGSAILYNYSNASDLWITRTTGLLAATSTFLSPFMNATGILYETECEKASTCNPDQQSFKGYLARWLAATARVAPYTRAAISQLLRSSAQGAAASCSGGVDNQTCGTKWYTGGWDGTYGVGQQLTAMEVIQVLLLNSTTPPSHLPNVHIGLAPATTIIPVAIPGVTASSRPLHDHPNKAFGRSRVSVSLAVAAFMVFFYWAIL